MIFDERSCITDTVTRLSGFSSEDWKIKELDLSFLIVLKSVSTPTVMILFELNVVELNGVSPSNVNLSALSISFVAIVTLWERLGRITYGSGGTIESPTNTIFVPIVSSRIGLRKWDLPNWENLLIISSSVRDVITYDRSIIPIWSLVGDHRIFCEIGSNSMPIGGWDVHSNLKKSDVLSGAINILSVSPSITESVGSTKIGLL